MQIRFKLTEDAFVKHNEVITLPEEKVELIFENLPFTAEKMVLFVNYEGKEYKCNVKPEIPVDVTAFFQKAGEVKASLALFVRGTAVKEWIIEPFAIVEAKGTLKAIPEIEYLKSKVERLEQAINEITNLINN